MFHLLRLWTFVATAFWGVSCGSSTLPSAEKLSSFEHQLRQRAEPEFNELDRRRSSGELSAEDYQAERAALDQRIVTEARDAAWSQHFLAESQKKAMGIPTPDQPVFQPAPNVMTGGGGGSLYRPFTMQSNGQGATNAFNASVIPSFGNTNNASTLYVQPAR